MRERYRYVTKVLGEIPYRIYGPDNFVHYGRNLGDDLIQDARLAPGYYIVHGGPNCKRSIDVIRKEYGEGYFGDAYCLIPKKECQDCDGRGFINFGEFDSKMCQKCGGYGFIDPLKKERS